MKEYTKYRDNTLFSPVSLCNAEQGWTFVETLVVMAIVLILTGSATFMAFKYLDKANTVTAKTQIEAYSIALHAYRIDCGTFPSEEQGLKALWEKPILEPVPSGWNGPYVNKNKFSDPWGNAYEYSVPGVHNLPFGIRSFGADGKEGGEGNDGDIASWEM